MKRNKKGNYLVIIENGKIISYELDNRNIWNLGRPSPNNDPDIKLHTATVSRKHGKFQNMDGIWFYLDYGGKNGTVYNHKHIEPGLKGNVKPILLEDGDVFVFGGGDKEVINCKTVFGLFLTRGFDERWRVVDSKDYSKIEFISESGTTTLDHPDKGTVIEKNDGVAIYMGSLTYVIGNMEVNDIR